MKRRTRVKRSVGKAIEDPSPEKESIVQEVPKTEPNPPPKKNLVKDYPPPVRTPVLDIVKTHPGKRKIYIGEIKDMKSGPLRIAVYADDFGYPRGIYSCHTTEARLPMNYAIMLAHHGHKVDFITEGAVFGDLENFCFTRLSEAKNREYDICIACQDKFPNIIKAKRHIVLLYLLPGKAFMKQIFSFSGDVRLFSAYYLKGNNFPIWPYPIFTELKKEPNIGSRELLWVCKHNPSSTDIDKTHWDSFNRLLRALRSFPNYSSNALFLNNTLGYFREIYPVGFDYDNLLHALRKYRSTLSFFYGATSLLESILSGCVPMLWNNPAYGKGDLFYSDIKDSTIFNVSDTEEVFRQKLFKLLMEKDYYVDQWEKMYDKAKVHLPDNSYQAFCEIIGDRNEDSYDDVGSLEST